jgi:acyl-coenzyme A thioesterase PaaI-like protein
MVRPVQIGARMHFRGRIVLERSRLTISEGEAVDDDGELFATAMCKMMRVPAAEVEEWERSGGSL